MVKRDRARGSIIIVIVVMVLLVGALGFVGWRMLTRQDAKDEATKVTNTSAKVILTADDLDAAKKSLDELDFTDEDSASAEQQANL